VRPSHISCVTCDTPTPPSRAIWHKIQIQSTAEMLLVLEVRVRVPRSRVRVRVRVLEKCTGVHGVHSSTSREYYISGGDWEGETSK
jgi:hypothetical protein